jgi:hypothetical protein
VGEERRTESRTPSFRVVDLVVRKADGGERSVPIMLRDASPGGYGGVYIDQEPLSTADSYSVREDPSTVTAVRMVWMHEVADYVFLLGMQRISEEH